MNERQILPHKVLFDPLALYAALDAQRASRSLSWRQVAAEAGLSPALLSRLPRGHRPDVDSVLSLCAWLGTPVETFAGYAGRPDPATKTAPSLITQVVPLLRAHLNQADANYVEALLRATMKWIEKR